MDIKDLNKTQMILLVLLVCFVVSIATGIVTVSLMQQVPKSVPQTINRVIERTINNVTTPAPVTKEENVIGNSNATVQIFMPDDTTGAPNTTPLGKGVIISEVGLVLVENSILQAKDSYKIMLDKDMFDSEVLQRFSNGFTILKILPKSTTAPEIDETAKEEAKTSNIDIKP